MRYSDFRLTESVQQSEFEAQKAIHDLDVIKSSVADLPPERDSVKMKLASKLKKMSASISSFLQKAKIQSLQTSEKIQEDSKDSAIFDTIETLKQQILAIEKSDIDEKLKQQFITPFRQNLDDLTRQVSELKTARDAAVQSQKEAANFIREVSKSLVALGNKVQGYKEENLDDLSSKEKTAAKKRKVSAEEFTKVLKQALFGKIVDIQEESDVTPEEIKTFLEACVNGDVINMLSVIETDRGNIKDHVNPRYQKIFDIFVEQNIFSYSPGKTSGAIGPGEMALSMMGNPAEKGKKGDLKIGDKEVEIKASASSGGRLNSKKIAKATSGWSVWSKHISNILSSAPKNSTIYTTNKKGERVKIPISKFDGNQYNVHGKSVKLGSKYNWNKKGFTALNEEVLEPYSDFNKTFDMFHETIKALVQNFNNIPNADKLIASAINQDGTVDFTKMTKAYSKIAYESYHQADGITTIMFLRTDTLDYTIIHNGDDLVNKLGDTVVIGVGFNWNDDQQNPTPGFMAAKS